MRRTRLLPILAALVLAAAGCGDEFDQTITITEDGGAAAPAETATATATPPAGSKDLKDTKVKPLIEKPSGDPPKKLVIADIVKGKGKVAKKGDTVSVQYVGVSWSTGEQFDASWDRGGEPFSFTLGKGDVIKGWDRGVARMRTGGRRQLTIPPELAYGANGSPPAIGPDETLIFIVDLVKVQ
jgi:peptidylprolyl isomerase